MLTPQANRTRCHSRKRGTLLLVAGIVLAPFASAEICRSVSASWTEAQSSYRTQLWTSGENGCKKIEHTITNGTESQTVSGFDCNCDLKADGQEARISGAPHASNQERLKAICTGPMADKPAGSSPAP